MSKQHEFDLYAKEICKRGDILLDFVDELRDSKEYFDITRSKDKAMYDLFVEMKDWAEKYRELFEEIYPDVPFERSFMSIKLLGDLYESVWDYMGHY